MINLVSKENKQVVIEKLQEYKDKLAFKELELINIESNSKVLDFEIKELKEAYDIMIQLIYEIKSEDLDLMQKWKKSANELGERKEIKRIQLFNLSKQKEELLKSIPNDKKLINHGEFLISKIMSFEEIENIPIHKDFGFLKPMVIGYEHKSSEPMVFELKEIDSSPLNFIGSSSTIFKYIDNNLKDKNGKTLEFNEKQKSEFLFLFKHFEINSFSLEYDHCFQNLVDNSHLKIEDILVIDGGGSTTSYFNCKINIFDINSSWSGRYVNAPLRLKIIIDYLLSLSN